MSLIAFYYPAFAGSTASWTPAINPNYPLDAVVDYPFNLKSETAGGGLYVQSKGAVRESFELRFELMSKTDRDNLLTFYKAVQRELKTFEYKDVDGVLTTVRITNAFNFRLDRYQLYSGSVSLRKE